MAFPKHAIINSSEKEGYVYNPIPSPCNDYCLEFPSFIPNGAMSPKEFEMMTPNTGIIPNGALSPKAFEMMTPNTSNMSTKNVEDVKGMLSLL